jgi:uncharacterized spore protein YtfJ
MPKKKTELVEAAPAAIIPAEETPAAIIPAEEAPFDVTMSLPKSMEIAQSTMEKFLSAASVSAVYGEPIKSGDALIIPTAEVLSGLGFGIGAGVGNNAVKDEEGKPTQNSGGGGGGGGGGRVLSRPVAVIIASPEGVRVEPVVDVTKVALAALTAGGFILGMLLRMLRGRISEES